MILVVSVKRLFQCVCAGWLVVGLLSACQPAATLESFGGPTMGSTYSVKYVHTAKTPDTLALKQGIDAILADVDKQLSTWRADSLVSTFNQAPAGTCMPMPVQVLELVSLGESLSEQSGGAFDLTLFPLLRAWGFGPAARAEHIPSAEEIALVKQEMGHQFLHVREGQLCKDVALKLDFNSVAAGQAVDRMAAFMEAQGVRDYMVEATGELKAVGRKPDGSAWRIAIEAPRDDQQVAQKILNLEGVGLSTSGDYRNYFEKEGRRYSHTIDVRTGAPITHRLASVTVAHPQAMLADGLSTLLMILGPEEGMTFAKEKGLAAFFIVREGEGFSTMASPAFSARFPEVDKP